VWRQFAFDGTQPHLYITNVNLHTTHDLPCLVETLPQYLLLSLDLDLLPCHVRYCFTHFNDPLQLLDSSIAAGRSCCCLFFKDLRLKSFPQHKCCFSLVANQFIAQLFFHTAGLNTR
jgi:hypothetical protein